jgi:AraC-like DNA-binding protein
LILAYDKDREINSDESAINIETGFLVPKKFLPKSKQYTFMFELCYLKEMYIGFLLMEMGTSNIPIYDTIRAILSPSLYATVMMGEKFQSVKEKELLLRNTKIKNILNNSYANKIDYSIKSLNSHKILDYLCSHINDPTNLDKISKDLNTSKSSLIQKTKLLTGYSLQKLHELLKIERAKLLLDNKIFNISEIADKLGYQNQFYFSNVFKKQTGLSPKRWVEKNKK